MNTKPTHIWCEQNGIIYLYVLTPGLSQQAGDFFIQNFNVR